MKTIKTEAQITPGGKLLLEQLPFADGERVLVTIASPATLADMRSYAQKMATQSGEFVMETDAHTAERLLRETEW